MTLPQAVIISQKIHNGCKTYQNKHIMLKFYRVFNFIMSKANLFFDKCKLFALLIIGLPLLSCATVPHDIPLKGYRAFIAEEEESFISQYSPLFVIEGDGLTYNLIGTVIADLDKNSKENIFIDHSRPTIYFDKRTFATGKGSYTNLIYRIHFSHVPFSLFPFYIGKGRNVGLLTIVTLNNKGEPVLYTIVHTCGCYISFIPTSYMSEGAYREKWNKTFQTVFGERLPGQLIFPDKLNRSFRPSFFISSGNHRVKDVWIENLDHSERKYRIKKSKLLPMTSLSKLPLEGSRYTSFFEQSGNRKGYVKGSHKPWEKLMMSWWAFDWRIGEDKYLGKNRDDPPLFYTTLKPWDRKKSDMRDFTTFLEYWGWRL